jgi:spermidine synthase
MQAWQTIDRAVTGGGTELVLARRGEEWVVRAAGQVLMSSRVHGSEETLVKYALERVTAPRNVLIGGLGLGFTLRAALDQLPRGVPVEVAELVPELVRWNRTVVADLAGRPLDDPRVVVREEDVHRAILAAKGSLDLLVLDVDNGPSALTQGSNARLYSEAGARACAGSLRTGGVLALWSAGADERYRRNLGLAGFTVEVKTVAARPGSGARDVLFLAKKSPAARA